MNIEMRHILRWGVPGWVFLIANLVTLIYYNPSLISYFSESSIGITLLTTAILLWSGIVVGYLFYQVYFGVRELLREYFKYKDPITYRTKEGYVWHLLVLEIKDVEDRKYISERYAYYLTVLHGFGSLFAVWLITLMIDCGVTLFLGKNWFLVLKIIVEIFFATFAFLSYTHYHFDLQNFRIALLNKSKLLDDLLEKEKESTD